MWQQLIVAVIVVGAGLHACTKYLPVAWRRRIVYLLSARGADQRRMAAVFQTQASCDDGCASCTSCGSEGAASAPSASLAAGVDAGPARRVIRLHVQS
ncbi:MAG: DUF6587 family protein [Pseudomonadota bacterium]